MQTRRFIWVFLLVGLIGIVGCTRNASTPPADTGTTDVGANPTAVVVNDNNDNGNTETTPENDVSPMQTAVAGGFATGTALASQGGQPVVDGSQPTATTVPPIDDFPIATAVPPIVIPSATHSVVQPDPMSCVSPYTVRQGDWVWSIGRACNIHPDAIIAANNLIWPYLIYPGDQLVLPQSAPPFP